MWRYSEFISVRDDFIPVFSEEVDKTHQDNWKSFIPHLQMKELLEKLIRALERAHAGDNRSLWISGAYGTGKTFACFVVKHLLQDDPDVVGEYLQRHAVLRPLCARFLALRRAGRYLVVYRSASGHITSSRRLMIEIEQAVKEQLRAQDLNSPVTVALIDSLIERLSDKKGVFNWDAAFEKHRGRFLSVASADEAVERLRKGDIPLAEAVASVLESEGLMFLDSPSKVKEWIKNVIDANGVKGVFFIWDEFTEFFSNNLPVTPLQELAQATMDTPFYLCLVTHRSLNQFTRIDEDTRRKLMDRFHSCYLEMNPVTAYKLIANVIDVLPATKSIWESKLRTLWSGMDKAVAMINVLGERVGKEELMAMTPMHPFTAYLLSTISSLYSSSQRTLFQFLKTPAPGSFQWFIGSFPQGDWYWQTPDYLWEYFFEDPKVENAEVINDLLSQYRATHASLSDHALRVYRIILLLIALDRQTKSAHPLLRPKLSNLKQMLAGTLIQGQLAAVVHELTDPGLVREVPIGSDFDYIIPTATIDQTKLEECRRRVAAALPFEKALEAEGTDCLLGKELESLLALRGSAKVRHPIRVVSARDLRLKGDRCLGGVDNPSEIGLVFVVAQDDEHLLDTESVAANLTQDKPDYCVLISQSAFGQRRWDEWLGHRANALYYREMRDTTSQRYYDTQSREATREWQEAIRTGRIRAFYRGEQEELAGCSAVSGYMSARVGTLFPYGPERIMGIATLYDGAWGKGTAEIGLGVAAPPREPLKGMVEALKQQHVWDRGGSGRTPDHPVSRMQVAVDAAFASSDPILLTDLWRTLQSPPFGLMASPIGVCLFGLLLRDFASGYYYSDGTNSLPLNPSKLAELIDYVLKRFRAPGNYTIRKMSPVGEEFCNVVRELLLLSQDQTAYPEVARKNLRNGILTLGYPLWAVLSRTTALSLSTKVEPVITALCHIAAYEAEEIREEDMQSLVDAARPSLRYVASLLTKQNLQDGMRSFLRVHAPDVDALRTTIGLDDKQIIERLRMLLAEDVYLWTKDRIIEKLPELVRSLNEIDALNSLFNSKKQSLDELREVFHRQWFRSRLPVSAYKENQPKDISDLLDYVARLVGSGALAQDEDRSDDVRRMSRTLAGILSDPAPVVQVLTLRYAKQNLSYREAHDLHDSLPDLRDADPHQVEQQLLRVLCLQARQKLVSTVRAQWGELTGSETPEAWSGTAGVPIQWILQGEANLVLFERLSQLQQLGEEDLVAVKTYLEQHAEDLAPLHDERHVLRKLVEVAAGEYQNMVSEMGMSDQLKTFLLERLGRGVHRWPMRLNEVRDTVRSWVNLHYRQHAYPRVETAIDAIPIAGMRAFLKELAARDALVGARLLEMAGSGGVKSEDSRD